MFYPFSDETNASQLSIVTFLYLLVVFIIILPPTELISAGFSIQNIFSYFLVENEEITFIRYHIKRISIKYLLHSFLPFGYVFLLLYYCDWSAGIINAFIALLTDTPLILRLILIICLLIPLITSIIVFGWHLNDCYLHPIVRQLRLFIQTDNQQQQEQTWHAVESSINTEFRRYDKFTCGTATSNVRCYVLDSWILKCSMYHVNICQQSNVHVELIAAHDIHLQETNEVSVMTQYLNIMIKSYDSRIKPFYIRYD
jgi:hypothetical protein